MSSPLSKIVYPSSVLSPASPTTLNFQWAAKNIPGFVFDRVGTDTESSAGYQQSITQFVRTEFNVEMPFIAIGADLANWGAFVAAAIRRIPFDFYPDASQSAFNTCLMMDDTISAEYRSAGLYKIGTMRWKLLVA